MAPRTTKFDIAHYLETETDIAEYLSEALDLGDPAYFQHALGEGLSRCPRDHKI